MFLAASLALGIAVIGFHSAIAAHSECSDGLDNDGNGKTDYPQDDACESLDDDYEGISLSGNFITITDDKEHVAPGGSIIYIVTLKQQREDARLVDVVLHLPHQSNVVSASDGGSVSDDTIRWNNVSVYRNITRTMQVHIHANPDARPGEYLIARAMADGAEATDTTLVQLYEPQSTTQSLSVNLSDDREYAQPSDELTYTIRVRNISDRALVNDVRLNLPTDTYFVRNSANGRRDSYSVLWPSERFAAGEIKVFTATVTVDPRVHDRGTIRAKANAGTAVDYDQTIIKVGLPYDAITTSLSDGLETAERGQLLTYRLTLTNTQKEMVGTNIAVDAALPMYGEFVNASHNGYFDGSNIRWLVVNMAPQEVRHLQFTVRVRPDAPDGTVLTSSAVADGITGTTSRDSTRVVAESTEVSSFDRDDGAILFRKSADRSEAFAGGSIRFTLSVRNTLDRVISDAVILDRFDNRYLSFVSANQMQSLLDQSEGSMRWKVPVLQPGESWQASYILSVSSEAPAGLDLSTVATIRGSDLDGVALSAKVQTAQAGVIVGMPQTGIDRSAGIAILLALASGIAVVVQRRLLLSSQRS